MLLHITLNSGRTMRGGLTQSIIEICSVSFGAKTLYQEGEIKSHRVVSWRPVHNKGTEGIIFLHETDIADVKSNDGTVLHEWCGAEGQKQEHKAVKSGDPFAGLEAALLAASQ